MNVADRDKVMSIAFSQIGVTEWSQGENKEVIKYFHETGNTNITNDETAWCAVYVNWCLMKSGFQGSNSIVARSFMKYGYSVTKPKYGDLVVFWRYSPNDWRGHVGFYLGENDREIYVLGGNQKNMVNVDTYSKKQFLGYRRISSGLANVKTNSTTLGCNHPHFQNLTVEKGLMSELDKATCVPIRKPKLNLRVVNLTEKDDLVIENCLRVIKRLSLDLDTINYRGIVSYFQGEVSLLPLDELYSEFNLNSAFKLTRSLDSFNGITIFVVDSNSSLQGFALNTENTIFVTPESFSKWSSTIEHEICHILGMGHTFDMTSDEKEMFGIGGESEQFNVMNYNCYTNHITPNQINYIHNSIIEKFNT